MNAGEDQKDATAKPRLPHILQFFAYAHLPASLQFVSRPFCDLAHAIVKGDNVPESGTVTFGGPLPDNPERTVALRKLLEAKDAAVRAFLATGLALCLFFVSACGTSPAPAPVVTPAQPSGAGDVYVALGRAAARVGLASALRSRGVSESSIAAILNDLHIVVDQIIAGEGLTVVLDAVRWAEARARLTELAVAALAKANTDGQPPVIDEGTARILVNQLIDSFVAFVRSRL